MYLKMKITNVKSIKAFEFDIPLIQGMYALTGENGSGKSTILSCAATSFYRPFMYSYFGYPSDSQIEFFLNGKTRSIYSENRIWRTDDGNLGITGFFEGSLIFGNRFKDSDFSKLPILASVKKEQLSPASPFVREKLGEILRDDPSYYNNLFVMNPEETTKYKLAKQPYYYEVNNNLVNQLNMSTGENLLISILHSIQARIKKGHYGSVPALILLDEIELALHSSALRRLMYFLDKMSTQHNFSIIFSTHSIELIRSLAPNNIFYLQRHTDDSLEVKNPCFPVYATRNLESSNYGHDFIIMVEDNLARSIVDKILRQKRLLGNKRILVIAVGGWAEVLRFAYDTIRSNLTLSTTKIIVILDRDIKDQVPGFLKNNHIGFSTPPNYLPIKSLEKYLLYNLITCVDQELFRTLSDYVFQNRSLSDIVAKYQSDVKNGVCKNKEEINNGKTLFGYLTHELQQIRKYEDDISDLVVEHLFRGSNQQICELSNFLENELIT